MNDEQTDPSAPETGLPSGGEMERRTLSFDWSNTPVGPASEWPQGLKTALRIMLGSRYAMWLGWGPEFTFFYNDAYARMTLGPKHPWAFGRSAKEVWSEIWKDVGPRAESVIETGQSTWDEGLLLFLERRGYPEETYHTFSYSPLPDDEGGVGGMLCVVTEDTDRTIGERRLQTLRELAARTTDEPRTAEDACEIAASILGANPRDLPFSLLYLLTEDGERATLAGLSGVSREMPTSPAVVDIRDPDSPWPFHRVVEAGAGVAVRDLTERFGELAVGAWPESPKEAVVLPMAKPGQSQLAGFVVAGVSPRLPFDDRYRGFLDLTARQIATAVANARAYEEERRRAQRLAELDRAKTVFFSNVSHEFRTPLTLMLGPVEELLARSFTELSPAAKGQLEVVSRNGLRLLRLVNSLLDFSRIEAGRVRAVFQPTDLATYTSELASVFRSAVERAGLHLRVDCDPLDEPAYIDREMWEKIVLNLLSNAFKFTFDGEIAVILRGVGNSVDLRVRDTGTGIPAEEMSRLFERFHRIENARARTHEGSGIGLALVQELVKLHGGSITVESAAGKGSEFIVKLPLGHQHLPADQIARGDRQGSTADHAAPFVDEALSWLPDESSGEPPAESALADMPESVPTPMAGPDDAPHVLVADDNSDMRRYITRLLSERYHVTAVADGEEALAAVRERAPDLVLTDVMMPRLDGFGLLQALRNDPQTSSLPVLLLSARAGEESRVEGMDAGADDYLVKPFSARELLARVGAHLQMSRMRREANESIKQGEERLRIALVAARMIAWQWDLAEDRMTLSANADEVFGLPAGAAIESRSQYDDLIHREDIEKYRSTVEKAARDCDSYIVHYRIVRPDDQETIWLEERGHAVRGEGDAVEQMVGVVMDVSERRRAAEALQRERDLLSVTLASIGDAVITTDTQARITRMNAVAEELTGWSQDEAAGMPLETVFNIVNEMTREPVENPATRALREGLVVGLANHTILIQKDGGERPIDDSAAPIRRESGAIAGCVLVFRDVTERRRAEAALRESEALFRSMADNAPALIWVTDECGACTYISRRWCEHTGTTLEQNLGYGWVGCVHPDDSAKAERNFLEASAAQVPFTLDYRLRRHDGEYRWAVDDGRPRFDADGRFLGFIGTVTDVHERELATEALRKAANDLAEADRQKTEFLATLGHELRNPLAPIRTGLELLGMLADDRQQSQEVRGMMERQMQQMVRLIDDLLDVARITRGKFELRKTRTPLGEVVSSAVEAIQPFIDEANHQLTVALPSEPVELYADPNRLAQIISNLLNNSVKYTPDGGQIWLTAKQEGEQLLITVADTGVGIPPDMQGGIFDMFAQIDRPLEKGHRGLGIGLTLVKRLVELHGGAIEAHSEGLGKGSEFRMSLPIVADLRPAASPASSPAAEAGPAAEQLRVLVVDDNKDAADTLGMVVQMLGNDVRTANDGVEAVAAAEEFRPHVVFMDLGMPRMNGYEATQAIRAEEWGKSVTIVALTGWGQDRDRDQTKAAGFDHHLTKPAEPSELMKILANVKKP